MNIEQCDQLAQCLDALRRDFYHPLGVIDFSGFRTAESLTPAEATARPCPPARC